MGRLMGQWSTSAGTAVATAGFGLVAFATSTALAVLVILATLSLTPTAFLLLLLAQQLVVFFGGQAFVPTVVLWPLAIVCTFGQIEAHVAHAGIDAEIARDVVELLVLRAAAIGVLVDQMQDLMHEQAGNGFDWLPANEIWAPEEHPRLADTDGAESWSLSGHECEQCRTEVGHFAPGHESAGCELFSGLHCLSSQTSRGVS